MEARSLCVAKSCAYATLITRASYLAGVVILAHTLRKNVVLYTPTLSQNALQALRLEANESNIILRPCDVLLPPKNTQVTLIAERFADTWTKLRVFELAEYDVVCYLDADMAIFRNADSVFEKAAELPDGWIGTNHSCVCNRDGDPWAPEDWKRENCAYTPVKHPEALTEPTQPTVNGPRTHTLLNGGMFLFKPTPDLWADMLSEFHTTPLLSSFKFPDQDFLAHYFRGRWRALGWQYNALKTMRYWHENIWRDEEVVCLHYVVDKPWAKRNDVDGIAGYKGRDGVTHQWWWDAYEQWEDERTTSTVGDAEVVALSCSLTSAFSISETDVVKLLSESEKPLENFIPRLRGEEKIPKIIAPVFSLPPRRQN
ncbi:nucleotide-diphospho-sugar transferase [Pestalotiopsis sp. NC0098]|nr:nucleotide-diphospho-sugar transferase [Pestalotiopsis sp. NC0098]